MRMEEIATQVYKRLGSQYEVPKVPVHAHTGIDTDKVKFRDLYQIQRFILYRVIDPSSICTATPDIGGDFVMPYSGFITEVGATVDTAGTTGTMTLDINKNGTSILRTLITIDTTEKTSRDAAVPSVLSSSKWSFNVGDIFTFDIDAVQSVPAEGLTFFINTIT